LADRADTHRAGLEEGVSAFCLEMMSALKDVALHLRVAGLKGSGDGVPKALALASLEMEKALDTFDRHRAKLLRWDRRSDEPKV